MCNTKKDKNHQSNITYANGRLKYQFDLKVFFAFGLFFYYIII